MDRDALEAALVQHPLLRSDLAKVMAGQESVDLARESYKPGWSLGVNYGFRDGENLNGSKRADFLSAMVTVDLPIFRDKRQDRSLAASQHELDAMRLARDERMRLLLQNLHSHYIQWQRLGHRADLYADTLQLQAQENAQATLLAYQNDSADFAALTRARITELDTRLQALRIRVDRAKVQADLLYLSGGVQ
jgi:outer membrane protein TolC